MRKERGPPTDDDVDNCRLKHFLNFDDLLQDVMTKEELDKLSREEKFRRVCQLDIGGYWVKKMMNNKLWRVVLRGAYTTILEKFERVLEMLQRVPSDHQVTSLDDRPETYYLVGPVPTVKLTLIDVPNHVPAPLPDQPFAMKTEYLRDINLKWDFADETKKSIPLGTASLQDGAYNIFSSRIKRWRNDFIFRSDPVQLQYLMLLCDSDRRPYHLEFTFSDENFIVGNDAHNLEIMYTSNVFQWQLNKLKSKLGIVPSLPNPFIQTL